MKSNWQKLTYKVDPLNRLVITEPFAPNSPLYKKVVLDGKFTIDKDNSLIYHLTSRLGRPALVAIPAPDLDILIAQLIK